MFKKNIDQCLCSNQPKNTEEGPLVIAIRDLGKHEENLRHLKFKKKKKGFLVMRSGD